VAGMLEGRDGCAISSLYLPLSPPRSEVSPLAGHKDRRPRGGTGGRRRARDELGGPWDPVSGPAADARPTTPSLLIRRIRDKDFYLRDFLDLVQLIAGSRSSIGRGEVSEPTAFLV